jgi:hypothetical protein
MNQNKLIVSNRMNITQDDEIENKNFNDLRWIFFWGLGKKKGQVDCSSQQSGRAYFVLVSF